MIPLAHPRLVALLAVGLAMAGLTAWALAERAARMSCAAERATLAAQVATLGEAIQRQNQAVERLAKTGRQQREAGAQALAQARADGEAGKTQIARLEALLAARSPAAEVPIPPQPPGAPAIVAGSCAHALALIRQELAGGAR